MAFERDPRRLYPHDYLLKYTVVPLVPRFVTPNAITVFRFLGTPVVLYFLLVGNYAVGVPAFLFLAFTDALDGTIARLRNQVTAWGSFYDPVADKLLIGSVVLLVVIQHINPILGVVVLALEALIMLGGILRRRRGHVTTANVFGKTKMFLQVVGVSFLLISLWTGHDLFVDLSNGSLAIAVVFAVISLFTYGL